ncbi:MAG: hypothetical protein PHE17_19490 [Thiothrix sp.]|uniref:hypothetical protein n=1 Tax=Thiothrix sp. TaxID=1032 RepID=UPI002612D3C5|nr:hypothetical protein [Thiothrix sp.]MDD5395212.1 hypothetical protein [Thiothrix sp.]
MWRIWTMAAFGSVGVAQYQGLPIADGFARAVQNSAVAVQKDDAEYFERGIQSAERLLSTVFGAGELEYSLIPPSAYDSPVPDSVRHGASSETLAMLVHIGESRRRGYNDYNRGSDKCRGSNAANIALTDMTFAQIAAKQRLPRCHPQKFLAVGRYQDIDVTRAMRALNIKPFYRYTEAMQDAVFAYYLTQSKQPMIAHYIRTGKNLRGAGHAMAAEWASIQSPLKGRGLYDGKGTNKAHIKALRVVEALQRARLTYIAQRKDGANDQAAYAVAVGIKS